MDLWPWKLLTPRRERWWLQGVALNGGVNVGGNTSATRTDGGGIWVGEQTFLLTTTAQIKAARAIEAILDGGVGKIVAWSFEVPFSPVGEALPLVPHSDGSPFDDGALYAPGGSGGTITAACALRATTLHISLPSGSFQGGETFSIVHSGKGWRRYRVMRVEDGSIEIRPPLREAVPSETPIYFNTVGTVARLANPEEFFGALDPSRVVEVNAKWVEAF